MKNLITMFSETKVNFSISDLDVDVLKCEDIIKIKGGGQPILIEEYNIIVED